MSTDVRTVAVHSPTRWFMAGVATTMVALALAAGLGLAVILPGTQPGELASVPAPASLLDAGLRIQRAGEIGAGRASVLPPSLSGLTDHRKGEIDTGLAGASGGVPELTDHRRGEINEGQ